jgi:hypothetical protein
MQIALKSLRQRCMGRYILPPDKFAPALEDLTVLGEQQILFPMLLQPIAARGNLHLGEKGDLPFVVRGSQASVDNMSNSQSESANLLRKENDHSQGLGNRCSNVVDEIRNG